MRTPLIPLLNGFFPRAAALCWWSASAASQPRADCEAPASTQDTQASVAGDAPHDRLQPLLGGPYKRTPLSKSSVRFDITRAVRRQIELTLGCHLPERGGLLGGRRQDGLITHFWHDDSPLLANASTYEPNHVAVNSVLRTWNAMGIELIGMVHSHPGRFNLPSVADSEYARRILAHNPLIEHFFMPIVLTRPASGGIHILPYVVERANPLPFALCDLRTVPAARCSSSAVVLRSKRAWAAWTPPMC